MKSKITLALFAATLSSTALLAGALLLKVTDPLTNSEATARHAAVMAQMTACHSPEKTTVTATAEGVVNGKRITRPLQVIKLSTPGMFAVARDWPSEGTWAVRMVATNPEYQGHATGVLIPVERDTWSKTGAKEFFHAPTDGEVDLALR